MALLQQEPLSVWIAHIAPLLGLLRFESADGSVENTDPQLRVFKRVRVKLKHSVDDDQVKAIRLVILKVERESIVIP